MEAAAVRKITPPRPDSSPAPLLPEALFKLPHAVLTAAIRRELPLVLGEIEHLHAAGVSARILRLPAGTLATARRHLQDHLCFLIQGSMTVWQEGEEEQVIDAPRAFVAKEGDQYMGYVHEDAVWVTVFSNPENVRDLSALLDANESLPPEPNGAVPVLREIFDAAG